MMTRWQQRAFVFSLLPSCDCLDSCKARMETLQTSCTRFVYILKNEIHRLGIYLLYGYATPADHQDSSLSPWLDEITYLC